MIAYPQLFAYTRAQQYGLSIERQCQAGQRDGKTLPANGYHVAKPLTNLLVMFYRAFVEKGNIAAAVAGVKAKAGIFRLSQAAKPPATSVVNISGVKFNTISANDFSFYEELNAAVQNEPADWVDPDTVGLYASIGIRKGQRFAPDARMKGILTDAVAVANAIARSDLYASRDPRTPLYTDRQWFTPFVGGSWDRFRICRALCATRGGTTWTAVEPTR